MERKVILLLEEEKEGFFYGRAFLTRGISCGPRCDGRSCATPGCGIALRYPVTFSGAAWTAPELVEECHRHLGATEVKITCNEREWIENLSEGAEFFG